MAEKYMTQTFETFSQSTASSERLKSLNKIYTPFVPRNREDYPRAVDEDDLDVSVLPIPTMVHRQGPSAEDGFDILDDGDDETGFGRCYNTIFCEPNESAQYFDDEDLFGRLCPDSDYEDSEEELSEEDMLFGGSGWDSDDTVTDAGPVVLRHIHRDCDETEEDDAQYFDADDLFEREEADEETLCWCSEDWDFVGKEREKCWLIDQ